MFGPSIADRALTAIGYVTFVWNTVMRWPKDDMYMLLVHFRKEMRSRAIHAYVPKRIIVARKPGQAS